MAAQLQLLFQLATPPPAGPTAQGHGHPHISALAHAFGAKPPDPKTTIIHYLWVTMLPETFTNGGTGSPFASGGGWFILNVAYDLDFYTYVKNLVLNDIAGFNKALPAIKGTAPFLPLTKDNVDPFINWVAANDLAQVDGPSGTPYSAPLTAMYPYSAFQIITHMKGS